MMKRKQLRTARAWHSTSAAGRAGSGKRAFAISKGLSHANVKRPSSEIDRWWCRWFVVVEGSIEGNWMG